nr:TadE family protein [uncultured Halomonas sp.]
MNGSSMVELVVIGVPLILFLTLGMFQLILIGHARVTVNYAALMAAREGALHHADIEALERGLAEGLAPLYGALAGNRNGLGGGAELLTYALPQGDGYRALSAPQGAAWWNPANPIRAQAQAVATDYSQAEGLADAAMEVAKDDIEDFAAITILNPTKAAFTDFARQLRQANNAMGIPNIGLYRMTGKGAGTTQVQICEPTVTPTVKDPYASLNPDIPTKRQLQTALLDGVADDYWSRGKFDGDVSKVHISQQFKDEIRSMIDATDFNDEAAVIDLYHRVEAKALEYANRYRGEIPDWQISQFVSVAKRADILSASTSGPYRPSEDDLRVAVGDTGRGDDDSGGLDYGDDETEDAWDAWACGDPGFNQDGTGCEGGNSVSGGIFGDIDDAFESDQEDINYQLLANRIAANSAAFMAGNIGASDGELGGEQQGFVRQTQTFFEILGKPQEQGPYQQGQICRTETIQTAGEPQVGTASGVNIQDANLLKIHVVYGYELIVPFVGPIIVEFMQRFDNPLGGGGTPGPLQAQIDRIYADNRIPITATAVVRMQSPAFVNDAMVEGPSAAFFAN